MEQQGELLSVIKILGAVAQADGKVDDRESSALAQALIDWQVKLPDGVDARKLLDEPIDLEAELARVQTQVVRRGVFEAAVAMTLADGKATSEENRVLGRIRNAFAPTEGDAGERAFSDSLKKSWTYIQRLSPILDPIARAEEVNRFVRTKALVGFMTGLIPFPFVSGVLTYWVWDATIDGVSMLWGHPLTRAERAARFGGTLSFGVAGAAVASLVHVVPFWGQAMHAAGGYATTMAFGHAANKAFESEGKLTDAELKTAFAEGKTLGKKAFEEDKAMLETVAKDHKDALAALGKKLEAGEITPAQYEAQLAEMTQRSAS